MKVAILGAGFIGRFYTEALHGQRNRDHVVMAYARDPATASRFAVDHNIPHHSSDLVEAVEHAEVEAVVIALPNFMHEEAVMACVKAMKPVLCTKPLGRNAAEAHRMLLAVESAGLFAGYLEDLCYTPKFMKSLAAVKSGSIGRVLWAKSRETHPGPHSEWFWSKELAGGGAIIDLGCHCVEIARSFIGKAVRPLEVMCWAATQVKPIDAEDHAIGLVKYDNGAIGQFEVSWTFRGGMDLRDEVMGTEGTIWLNSFLRTGFEMFTTGQGAYISEKSESSQGWLFPVGDEVHELGYTNMFTDMFNAIETKQPPAETFYDGYVVNAILDAAYLSARTKSWEPVLLETWRGEASTQGATKSLATEYDAEHLLIKEEVLPDGRRILLLKEKSSGKVIRRELPAFV